MCRLFGFRSQAKLDVHHSLIAAENALMVQSHEHPHGWGIGYFDGGSARVHKSSKPAFQDEVYKNLGRSLASATVVAHVRQATVGCVDKLNTHPFLYQNWVFAHNGDVHGFRQLRPYLLEELSAHFRKEIKGSTDSEHCFYLFLSELESRCELDEPDADGVEAALATCMQKIACWCRLVGITRAPCMNILVTNGSLFAASRLGREMHFSTQKISCSDFAACTLEKKACLGYRETGQPLTHVLVASEKISSENLWEEMPNNSILMVDEALRFRLNREVVSLANLEFSPMPASLNEVSIAN